MKPINSEIVDFARQLLKNQSFVPDSPAAIDDKGRLCLCAAGLLARAGLLLEHPDEECDALWSEAARTKDKAILFSSFARLGWSTELCQLKITENDSSDPSIRRDVVDRALAALSQ